MAKQFKKKVSKVQKVNKKVVPTKSASRRTSSGTVSMPSGDYVATIGRRKTATARVRVYAKPGDYIVNEQPMAEYFAGVVHPENRFLEPFRVTETLGKFAVSVKVAGSGPVAQLEAAVLGIARALVKMDSEYKKSLKAADLLTRDARMKESRSPGTGGKARAKRQSPKR